MINTADADNANLKLVHDMLWINHTCPQQAGTSSSFEIDIKRTHDTAVEQCQYKFPLHKITLLGYCVRPSTLCVSAE
ncbi:unnamed protein product [Dovyalis caffra]|uniref:Uncharacterized protein n=1 Tax=Dovyalis caffra TaxID=77055 RepID=A0AAV1RXD7_9ROSI|nr:unnamed protein product [Dovyalis caffra]